MGGMNDTFPPLLVLGIPSSWKLFDQMLLRPPLAVNCEAPLLDHACTTLLSWSCGMTPGESSASSVTTCDDEGISRISSLVTTVPETAEVSSISGASAVTTMDCEDAPTSSDTSIC